MDDKTKRLMSNHIRSNDFYTLLPAGAFRVIIARNYYEELHIKEAVIYGESYERAKFYFNNSHVDWRVLRACG